MRILVLCTGNSCRSQMAHGNLKHFTGPRAEVRSAGLQPHGVDPRAIAVMKEDGIDISRHTSDPIDAYRDTAFDHVITVCDRAQEHCPWIPGPARKHHRNFADPAKATGGATEVMEAFRSVRFARRSRTTANFVERYTRDRRGLSSPGSDS